MDGYRIGFVSTRLAGTDGVSLETRKWREVLDGLGHRCAAFAGEIEGYDAAQLVPLAHFDHPEVLGVQQDLFGSWKRDRSVSREVHRIREVLVEELHGFIERFAIDILVPENTLAIPMHIPLGLAIAQVVAETGIPTIAHHHDFSWERDRFRINACGDYLASAFPPNLPSLHHVVINTFASEQLAHRRGLSSTVVPNVWDFDAALPPSSRGRELRAALGFADDEVLVLQPTRVVPRKWIERAIEIVRDLGFSRLVITHPARDEGLSYATRLRHYAQMLGVELVDASDLVGADRGEGRPYTLDDAYQAADLVTYTSGFEGFGNAFVEAVYHRRPVVVNRYAVYVSDIEPRGFDAVAINGFADADDIARIRALLDDTDARQRMVERNFALGRRHFSYEVLGARLSHLLATVAP